MKSNNLKSKYKYLGIIAGIIAVIWGWNALADYIDKDWYVTEHLGNHFVLHERNDIMYQLDDKVYDVIPYTVQSLNYDEKWIIAKTNGMNASFKGSNQQCEDGSQYWIINKDAPIFNLNSMYKSKSAKMLVKDYPDPYNIISTGVIGPLDSVSFNKKLFDLKIKLALKELNNEYAKFERMHE